MRRTDFIPAPKPLPMPLYVYKRYYLHFHLQNLIQWSIKEYNRRVRYLNQNSSPQMIRFYLEEYSAMRVLAENKMFWDIIKMLTNDNYNKLSARERVFVRRAYEMYKALGGT